MTHPSPKERVGNQSGPHSRPRQPLSSRSRIPLPCHPEERSDVEAVFRQGPTILAGRLGFEPRQSAPKALDLPLVDRPKPELSKIFCHPERRIRRNCGSIAWGSPFRWRIHPARGHLPSNIPAQYSLRGNVRVATAFIPLALKRAAARDASSLVRNNPYRVDPDPESDAYTAPSRVSALLTSRNTGISGKTTRSKSFEIPVRTRSRSSVSARSPLNAGTPDPAVGITPTTRKPHRLNSFIVSEPSGGSNDPSPQTPSASILLPPA